MELIKDLFYIESFLFPRVYSVSKAISHCRIPYWQFSPFTVLPSADRYHLSLYVRTLESVARAQESESTRWRVLVASLELTWISPIYILHASKLNPYFI